MSRLSVGSVSGYVKVFLSDHGTWGVGLITKAGKSKIRYVFLIENFFSTKNIFLFC